MKAKYSALEHSDAVIQAWAPALAARAGIQLDEFRAMPDRHITFPHATVKIQLSDGSSVAFRWAFALVDESKRAIAVFTEHCGHHVFPYFDATIRIEPFPGVDDD